MKRLFFLLATTLVFAACTKNTKETEPDPATEGTLTRTVVYTNQNNLEVKAIYSDKQILTTSAAIDGRQIVVGLHVMTLYPGNAGDGISFRIDKSFLQQGLQNTYSVDGSTLPAVQNTRYVFMVHKPDGGFWSSIHETSMGLKMEGSLTIAHYDAGRKLLSGSFNVVIKDLIHNPLNYNRVSTVDPVNLNTVTIAGTFSNVKLQNE